MEATNVEDVGEFDIDSIRDIVWDPAPYDNLVLPEGEKDLIRAFVNRPKIDNFGLDDFVAHKGTYEDLVARVKLTSSP